ncbi:response regulator [Noviherbaspirillum pedocola]|uniref:Response regulator n=1 Tax=Noviherbaspirillum pedocola TaxID=2801341 RepID=A0A934SMT0_9BURK|nr:response regulator [Noviherbaspirillum pedocola]MBK4733441.1 response regulator [Noviherbaspirillum pedocola]
MKRRILVVDDNVDAADSLAALLELYGLEVRVVYSGEEALQVAQSFDPCIAFLDIGMPGMDGFETARRLRTLPGGVGIRMIALTAWGEASIGGLLLEAGFQLHLVKPASINNVLAAINGVA